MNISLRHVLIRSAFVLACATLAFAHIRIAPTESATGAREKYTMRVPNEKQVNTIRVEGEFPAGLQIYDFEFKPGWKIDFKKDDSGKIVGATWTGKVQPYEFVFDSPLLRADPKLAAYARPSFAAGTPLLSAVLDLNRRIYTDFKYDRVATTVATPLEEVMEKRRGVCQDFAHLAIASLRSLGLAARYVSGYLRTRPPAGKPALLGADASHAWFSVFCPELGWVDFDPTNNLMPETDHLTLGYGRDFGDVSPISGILTGGGKHDVKVAVTVSVL